MSEITLEEIKRRVVNVTPRSPFVATQSIESIAQLFAHFSQGMTAFPTPPHYPGCSGEGDLLLYTSGSSGTPKIASLSIHNFIASARGAQKALALEEGDRWLLTLPLYHVGGIALLFRAFLAGASVIVSPLPLLDAIQEHKITHLSLVPTQLYRLLQRPLPPLPSLKCILLGGAPCPPSLLDSSLPIVTSYGMTETASLITCSTHAGALPGREIKIDAQGQILVRGDVLFNGYWDGKLTLPLTEDGWFETNDLGGWNNGQLEILGRKDNLFISGGENIHPEEIEAALCALPEIIEAIVVAKGDPEWGARPVAYVNWAQTLSLEEVRAQLSLPRFKHPVALYPLPQQAGLKPSRTHLAACANTQADLEGAESPSMCF